MPCLHSIYKITNKINGHAYVGRTKELTRRIRSHKNYSSCRYLRNAISKYGWESFKVETLEVLSTLEEAINAESKYILLHNTLHPNGYNLSASTCGPDTLSEEAIEEMSRGRQRTNNYKRTRSQFIGVTPKRKGTYFSARLGKSGKRYEKCFPTEIEAAQAYDRMALYVYGPTARINFIDSLRDYLQEDLESFFKMFTSRSKTSKYKNVLWDKSAERWRAYIYICNKFRHIGHYSTEEEAHQAVILFRKSL